MSLFDDVIPDFFFMISQDIIFLEAIQEASEYILEEELDWTPDSPFTTNT